MLRSGVPLDGLFGLACCPLCGQAGVPLDVRHVLSGECDAGASAEERAHAAALLQGLEAKLPLGADAHEGARLLVRRPAPAPARRASMLA